LGSGAQRHNARPRREDRRTESSFAAADLKRAPLAFQPSFIRAYNGKRTRAEIFVAKLRLNRSMPIHHWTRVPAGAFHHFHAAWIVELTKALNQGVLPDDYYAQAEQVADGFIPDVLTLRMPNGGDEEDIEGTRRLPASVIAVAEAPPRVRFTARAEIDLYAARARAVVVRHSSGDRVVALIEVVSPGNKSSQEAMAAFLRKAHAMLRRGRHLMLLDLFPPGPRDPAGIHAELFERYIEDDGFTLPKDKPLTLASYAAGLAIDVYVESVALGDVVPDMPLFLTPEAYVPTPLEAAYNAAYAAVPRRWRRVLEASG
jgi:hypothetical protein